MNITFIAVMNLTVDKRGDVRDKGYKVGKGIGNNEITFGVSTNPLIKDFLIKVDNLKDAIADEDGSEQKLAVSEKNAVIVFDDLKLLLGFVNTSPAKGVKDLLLLSNFEVNKAPVTHEIPGQLVIKRIDDGAVANTAKVLIETIPATDFVDRYKVETSIDKVNWTMTCETGNSNKLMITGTARGKEIFVRATGGNTHGFGKPSEPLPFLPR